jgi:hypothetical protein
VHAIHIEYRKIACQREVGSTEGRNTRQSSRLAGHTYSRVAKHQAKVGA